MGIQGIVTTTVLTLALIIMSTTTAAAIACDCGDICVNETGWWRDGGALNASTTPIQAAVDNTTAGETICVKAGSYTENVDIGTSHLTLAGEGAGEVTVTAASSSDHVFEVTADYVNISGFTVTGATSHLYTGINLSSADHCNISDNNCSNNYYGIYLSSSRYNTLTSNNCSNNYFGIYLGSSNNNTLTSNTANSNGGDGISLSSSSNITLTSNTASSNNNVGIVLYYSSNYNTLTGNTASSNNVVGIVLDDSSNYNTLTSNTASSNNVVGIALNESSNNTLTSNTADSNNDYGIYVGYSSNNTLTSNTADSNNDFGIYLRDSSNNTLMSNTADSNNYYGIALDESSNNTLTSNTADSNNDSGICLYYSSNNTLTGNTARSNNYYGIYLWYSSNNLIYNNYFNNTKNAYDNGNNQWNITKTAGRNIIGGPFLGGNYWSDYAGVDNDGDGLGNTLLPYNSSGSITNSGDYHPLILSAPAVTVLKPDGGEEIPGDSVYDITWNVTAGTYGLAADPINISYSNNSGATWSSIASNEANDGRYSWSVPNISSNYCLVSVTARDVNENTGSDVSDSTFTILQTDNSTNETIPAGETRTVEGPPESNTTVNVTAAGDVTVTVAYYNETPHPGATEPDGMVPKYIDIAFSDNDNVSWPIYVEMHYTNTEIVGLNESSLGLYYYEDGEWHRCNDTDVNVDENYVWANVTADECPGSPFGSGGSTDTTPPVITITTPVPYGLYIVGMTLDFSATDDESGVATIVGNLTNTSEVSQFVSSSFPPAVGVYTLVVTATDNAGNTNESDPIFFVVYDPDGGHATGGGWFYPDDESTLPGGKANFGFTARYKDESSTGKLSFQYKDADIHLKSTSIDWLTISTVSVRFQGTGTINGEGLYTFRVQVKDNGEPGAGSDHFDIKIWDGTDTEADPYHKAKNTISGGNIQVHTK